MKKPDRRHFLKAGAVTLTGLSLISNPLTAWPVQQKDITINDIIDRIIAEIPGGRQEETVDTIKSGDPAVKCTGIVTTFLATVEVIRYAVDTGSNFIITHEPTFYNHLDETDWLENNPVYNAKKQLLEENGIVVWRFHDYWHRYEPDGVLYGILREIGWLDNWDRSTPYVCETDTRTLRETASFLKAKMSLTRTFYIGNSDQQLTRVAFLPGAWGRNPHVEALARDDVDAIVIGELSEWEAAEYVRDAASLGMNKGIIILGHAESEEPGMRYAREWLQTLIPEVKVRHKGAGDPFHLV